MDTRRWALPFTVVALALIAACGVYYGVPSGPNVGLDGEGTFFAAVSGLLLFAAGLATFAFSRSCEGRLRLGATLFALLLFVLTADELLALHERLEAALGIDWEILYLPVFAAGGLGCLMLLRSIDRTSAVVLVLGGACWVASQLIEKIQWDGDTMVYPWTVIPEELLEATGSTLFTTAILLTGRVLARKR